MKKFIISVIVVVIGVLIIDRIVGKIMWWVNLHTQEHACTKIRHMVNDVERPILLMGTSRCHQHYVPSIIRDSIGMDVYNGGINSSDNIFAHYILLNMILQRYHPQVICLEVSANDFRKQEAPFNAVGFFAPYFGRCEQSDSVFRLANLYWQYKTFKMFRYNAKATSSIAGLFAAPADIPEDGYVPQPRPDSSIDYAPSVMECASEIDSIKINYIHRFISTCKRNKIQLMFTISPEYSIVTESSYSVLKTIAAKERIPLLDYHSQKLFLNKPELFHDYNHLWDEGARIYTSIFAKDLKQFLYSRQL